MPARMIGDANWMMQPGYPKLSGEKGSEQLELQFLTRAELMVEQLPEYSTMFYDERWPYFNTFEHLRLASRSIQPLVGELVYEISLVYSEVETQALSGDFETMEEVSYHSIEMDVPIETLTSKYKAKWNHSFIVKDGEAFTVEGWEWKTTTYLTPEEGKKWAWIKPYDLIPDGWWVARTETKPGVEVYKTFVPEVHLRKLCRSRNQLEKIAHKDGTKQTPPETFGYTGDWLQNGSSMQKEGQYWVLTTSFMGSKEIDDEIYD